MLLWFYCYMYLIEITFSIVFIYNIHFEKYVYNEYYSIYEEAICQRSGAWRGWGIKMRDFSVKHKFSKYKTNFPLSLKPQSRQTAVSCSCF